MRILSFFKRLGRPAGKPTGTVADGTSGKTGRPVGKPTGTVVKAATTKHDVLAKRYREHALTVAGHILQDAERGFVGFVLNGKDSQVHCTFEWFNDVTDGGDAYRVLTLRHALLTAMNILNVRNGQPFFSEDMPMPLFVTQDEQPCIQYLFWGKAHVRCERYDQDVAEAIAAYEEMKKAEAGRPDGKPTGTAE